MLQFCIPSLYLIVSSNLRQYDKMLNLDRFTRSNFGSIIISNFFVYDEKCTPEGITPNFIAQGCSSNIFGSQINRDSIFSGSEISDHSFPYF